METIRKCEYLAETASNDSNIKEFGPVLCSWLAYKGSLTQALQDQFGTWSLELIGEHWQNLNACDKKILNCKEDKVWVREIYHQIDGKKVVYAKVLLPEATYRAHCFSFANLGQTPIGTVLFNDPDLHRIICETAWIDINEPALENRLEHLVPIADKFAMRKSLLYFHNAPLMITEVFSPFFKQNINDAV